MNFGLQPLDFRCCSQPWSAGSPWAGQVFAWAFGLEGQAVSQLVHSCSVQVVDGNFQMTQPLHVRFTRRNALAFARPKRFARRGNPVPLSLLQLHFEFLYAALDDQGLFVFAGGSQLLEFRHRLVQLRLKFPDALPCGRLKVHGFPLSFGSGLKRVGVPDGIAGATAIALFAGRRGVAIGAAGRFAHLSRVRFRSHGGND